MAKFEFIESLGGARIVNGMQPLVELKDTQSEIDHRKIAIDRVGVKNLRYPITVLDKAHRTQNTIATVALTVDLPHHYKGTHMSRFIEALNEYGPVFHIEKIQKKAPVTGSVGLMDYTVRFSAGLQKGELDFVLTVIVPVTTLCPCSKAISASGAHNQRSQATYSVRFKQPIWIEDLIRLVESCASSELYSLLKRPDEKAVTERAYHNPVFVEDLVRNIAARSNAEENITWYRVEAENFESIHNHNAYALIEKG